jgi:hypothetical protein
VTQQSVTVEIHGRMKALRLEPGDVLVVHVDRLTETVAAKIRAALEEAFPGYQIVTFGDPARLEVIRPGTGTD